MGLLGPKSRRPPTSSQGGEAWGEGSEPCLPQHGLAAGQQRVEGGLLRGGQPAAALQVLQHTGVCGLDAGRIHVTHQDPKEQQVRGTQLQAGRSLPHSGSA